MGSSDPAVQSSAAPVWATGSVAEAGAQLGGRVRPVCPLLRPPARAAGAAEVLVTAESTVPRPSVPRAPFSSLEEQSPWPSGRTRVAGLRDLPDRGSLLRGYWAFLGS